MPIISRIEARSWRGWILYAVILTVLTVAGLTMVYPFAIMISGSLRTEMDEADLTLIPQFLIDEDTLYRKFLETKYNQNINFLNQSHRNGSFQIRREPVPAPEEQVAQRSQDLLDFMQENTLPEHWLVLGGVYGGKAAPENLRRVRDVLAQRFHHDLTEFSQAAGSPILSWSSISFTIPNWASQRYEHPTGPVAQAYTQVLQQVDPAEKQIVSISGSFLEQMIYTADGKENTDKFNRRHRGSSPIKNFRAFALPQTVPGDDQPVLRDEWLDFVRHELHPSFVTVDAAQQPGYQQFLAQRYANIAELNRAWNTTHATFESVPLPDGTHWLTGSQRRDFQEFYSTSLLRDNPRALRIVGPEYAWRDFLQHRYGTLEKLNTAHHAQYGAFASVPVPMDLLEHRYVLEHKSDLRYRLATRNYAVVFREILTQGRPLRNTVLVCLAAVVLGLLVNPLAAYAMSRYQLASTYKILLFLMATMAFPPMVTMVPQFLVLRTGGLLNTLPALFIPFLANGYMIFMLKGFFDSLPRDLYEAATIDGASELRIFFQITMALSKPILAVLALGEFTAAYSAFLYPLVVCPRPDMWTLNVWLYQWQSTANMACVFASLIVAAIPTIVIFLLAQNIIMRGIVIPTEK